MKTLFMLLLVLTIASQLFSQKKAMDLSMVPLTPDSTILGDSTKMMIQFKINYPDSVSGIQMKIGTAQDIADVTLLNPSIILSDTTYYTLMNGEQNAITDYDARVYYTLSENQVLLYNYLTLLVSYIDGTTDTLYWLKQDQNP